MTINYNRPNHICLHAFVRDDEGNEEYTDDVIRASGWSVYNFHEDQHYGPKMWTGEIDILDEADFKTYEEARTEAERRGYMFDVAVQEY